MRVQTSKIQVKTVTADLTTNYDAEMNASLAEKIKNVREHNFEGGASNSKYWIRIRTEAT